MTRPILPHRGLSIAPHIGAKFRCLMSFPIPAGGDRPNAAQRASYRRTGDVVVDQAGRVILTCVDALLIVLFYAQ